MKQIDYANLDFTKLSAAQIAAIHNDVKASANKLRRQALCNFWCSFDDIVRSGVRAITSVWCARNRSETLHASQHKLKLSTADSNGI